MTTRRYALTGQNVVNVKHYGATGDGHTNDRAFIQLAINAAFGTPPAYNSLPAAQDNINGTYLNKSLYFPHGHYIIDAPLFIAQTAGVTIFGDGKFATIIENTSADSALNENEGQLLGTWTHMLFYPQRSVMSLDGFQYGTVRGMTLRCVGGICLNVSYEEAVGLISSQQISFEDMRFECGGVRTPDPIGLGAALGNGVVPEQGIFGRFKTGDLTLNSATITNISPSTADLDPNRTGTGPSWLYVSVKHTPFVPGGDGLQVFTQVTDLPVGGTTASLNQAATTTATGVPLLFRHASNLNERNRFIDCDFIGCGFAGAQCGNPNSLQNCCYHCYFENCGTAILMEAGTLPTIYGCRFVDSVDYDIKFNQSYTTHGDSVCVAGCISSSRNFGLFHAGPGVALHGIIHDNASAGNFCFIEATGINPDTVCADACYSRNGNVTGNGNFFGRANTWGLGRTTAIAPITGSTAGTVSDF